MPIDIAKREIQQSSSGKASCIKTRTKIESLVRIQRQGEKMKIQANNRLITDSGLQDKASSGLPVLPGDPANPTIPAYLREVYYWAYLNSTNARLLDHDAIVSTILLGNNARLRRALISEIRAGQRVLQAAHVYGRLIPEIARQVGPDGYLEVIDLVPLQAALCRQKLRDFPHTQVRIANADNPGEEMYDVVSCFFLLHEIPDDLKRRVIDALLLRINPGGKVVFVDYHQPVKWHPLRGLMQLLFKRLEPFAESLWQHQLADFATAPENYSWQKQTFFGGLYQKTIAYRL
jgi:ubiquinone/menaquinone biosynthesis C-methylase UbiE